MYDQRLFNQTAGLNSGFADEEDYDLYDKPLFADRTAASIYKNVRRDTGQGNLADQLSDDGEGEGDGKTNEVKSVLRQQPARGFTGSADNTNQDQTKKSTRSKPVEFEKHQLTEDKAFTQGGLEKSKRARYD